MKEFRYIVGDRYWHNDRYSVNRPNEENSYLKRISRVVVFPVFYCFYF